MSPTSYHCSTPRPPMVETWPSSVKRSAALEDRAQDEECDDRDDLSADDHAIQVEGRLPGRAAFPDHEHPRRPCGQAEAPAAVAVGIAAAATAAGDFRDREEEGSVAFDRLAEHVIRLHARDRALHDLLEVARHRSGPWCWCATSVAM